MRNKTNFGLNSDRSRNTEYCCDCFKKGEFTEQDITMEKTIEKAVQIGIYRLDMTNEHARKIANGVIPKLKRWRS